MKPFVISFPKLHKNCVLFKLGQFAIVMETICCCYKHKLQEKKIHAVQNCNCKINGMEQGKNRAHMHTPTRHDEKSTGCCSLVSKAGMRMDVRDASRSGSLAKYLFRTFSKPFALYLGPFSAVKFIRVWLNGPLYRVHTNQGHPHTPTESSAPQKSKSLQKKKKNLFKELRKDLNTHDSGIEFSTTHCSKNCSAIERLLQGLIKSKLFRHWSWTGWRLFIVLVDAGEITARGWRCKFRSWVDHATKKI
jgi:hypothetical protein